MSSNHDQRQLRRATHYYPHDPHDDSCATLSAARGHTLSTYFFTIMANSAAAAATAVAVAASSNNQPEPEKQAADDRHDHLRQVALGILATSGNRLTEEEAEKEEAGHRIPVGVVVTNLNAAFEENGDDDDYDDDYVDDQTFATGDQTFATGDCLSQSQLGHQKQPGNVPDLDERQRSTIFSKLVSSGRLYKGMMTGSVAGGSYMNESQKAAVARDFRNCYTPANITPMVAMDTAGRPTITATNKLSLAQQQDKQWADNFVDAYEYADKNNRKNCQSGP